MSPFKAVLLRLEWLEQREGTGDGAGEVSVAAGPLGWKSRAILIHPARSQPQTARLHAVEAKTCTVNFQ